MKKLTNLQLQMLTEAFQEKLQESLTVLKATSEYQAIEEKVKAEHHYKKVAALIKKREALEKQQNELAKQLNELELKYKKITHTNAQSYNYLPSTMQSFDTKIQDKAIKEFTRNWPTTRQIQSQIVLAGVNGAENILDAVAKKFGLELFEEE